MPYVDREKQREACRRHYQANKAKYFAKAKVHDKKEAAEVRAYILEYLRSHPCIDCGENDPIVLEFDHRVGSSKLFAIGEAVTKKRCLRVVKEEIAKCDVRCANCHRRVTYYRAGRSHRDILN